MLLLLSQTPNNLPKYGELRKSYKGLNSYENILFKCFSFLYISSWYFEVCTAELDMDVNLSGYSHPSNIFNISILLRLDFSLCHKLIHCSSSIS